MKKSEEKLELYFRQREIETVSIEIPKDTLESLKKVANSRDMSCQALLKLYIGQGLRQDLAQQSADFWEPKTLEQHVQAQQTQPMTDIADLKADFWPKDESADDFIQQQRKDRGT